ncbi:collagen alpha-1(I) chain-like [Mustela lutreola]|uniref:collagen alpha-1(I) chain-like n=1 Tax=Mustela lutreola TaxID=9666 RepID=UPI002796F001|nr:collagen alpha-1(I) chain-like [Mustela lutreola]
MGPAGGSLLHPSPRPPSAAGAGKGLGRGCRGAFTGLAPVRSTSHSGPGGTHRTRALPGGRPLPDTEASSLGPPFRTQILQAGTPQQRSSLPEQGLRRNHPYFPRRAGWAFSRETRGSEPRGAPAPHRLQDGRRCPRLHAAQLPGPGAPARTAAYGPGREPGRPRAERSGRRRAKPQPDAARCTRLGRTQQAAAAEPPRLGAALAPRLPSRTRRPPPKAVGPASSSRSCRGPARKSGKTRRARTATRTRRLRPRLRPLLALRPRRGHSPTRHTARRAPAARVAADPADCPRGARAPGCGRSLGSGSVTNPGARGDPQRSGVFTSETPGPRGTRSVAGCGRAGQRAGARSPALAQRSGRSSAEPPRPVRVSCGEARRPDRASPHRVPGTPGAERSSREHFPLQTRPLLGADRNAASSSSRVPDADPVLPAPNLATTARTSERCSREERHGGPCWGAPASLNGVAETVRGTPLERTPEQLPVFSAETRGRSCPAAGAAPPPARQTRAQSGARAGGHRTRESAGAAGRGRRKGPQGPGALQQWGRGGAAHGKGRNETHRVRVRVRARRDNSDGKAQPPFASHPRSPARPRAAAAALPGHALPGTPTRRGGSSWKRAGGRARSALGRLAGADGARGADRGAHAGPARPPTAPAPARPRRTTFGRSRRFVHRPPPSGKRVSGATRLARARQLSAGGPGVPGVRAGPGEAGPAAEAGGPGGVQAPREAAPAPPKATPARRAPRRGDPGHRTPPHPPGPAARPRLAPPLARLPLQPRPPTARQDGRARGASSGRGTARPAARRALTAGAGLGAAQLPPACGRRPARAGAPIH